MRRLATSSTVTPVSLVMGRRSMMHSWATRPSRPGVEHRVVRLEALGDVVGVEDGHLGGPAQPVGAHHADVRPRDGQDAGRAPRGGRDRPGPGRRPGLGHERVVRQEGGQVRADADRADARAAAAVGDAERLVQVEVRHVGAEAARAGQADHGVEVGAVEVHLPAGVVHRGADLADGLLEHAVGGRVGDHERGQVLTVLVDLGAQVVEVDVAGVVAGHHDHRHAGHDRAGGVGAVGRGRDQADGRARPRPGRGGSARMASSPASSPWEPALGCSDTAS